jgi:fructose-1,6-bisphosphatase
VHQLTQQNLFGKTQSDLDLEADRIIFEQLKNSGVVHSAASEEKPYVSDRLGSTQNFNRSISSMRRDSTW